MSWDWQWHWWSHHAGYVSGTLQLLALYASSGELVGLAPFYVRQVRWRGWVRLRRMEVLGHCWRDSDAVFSEYLDLIAAREHEQAVLEEVSRWLEAAAWDDLVLPCLKPDSLARRLAHERLAAIAHVRDVDAAIAYSATLPATFATYVAALGSGTRRRLLNHRSKLRDPAIVEAGEHDIGACMDTLRAFESVRWGSKNERLYRFNRDFATSQARAGTLRLSRFVSAGGTLSVMYDVRLGRTEYYLQSAFDPQAPRGISPGYLHFGYHIERACAEGVTRFDLLAGRGRHRDYKPDLLTEGLLLVSCHIIRLNWLRMLYRLFQMVMGGRSAGATIERETRAASVSQFAVRPAPDSGQ